MNQELHLNDEQLSALVEGAIAETDRALLHEHVRKCGQCFAAFQDSVRYRGIWETDPMVFRAPDELIALAAIVPKGQPAATQPRPPRFAWWPKLGPALAGAAIVALVMVVAQWRPLMPGQQPHYTAYVDPIREAVTNASTSGAIVIPGGETAVATSTPLHRSGRVDPDPVITEALRELTRAYSDRRTSPDVAHWLVSGFLATGQLDNARVYVQDARLRYPDDLRFIVLDALVAYRSNDMPRAERLLQIALQTDPHNGAALINLGLVQYEQGHWDLARRTFEIVRTRFAGSPLEARAATLLSGLLGS